MRTKIIDNDIVLFLENEPNIFIKTIKKRLKSWETATDSHGLDFIASLLIKIEQRNSPLSISEQWSEIFDKLDKLNFVFKPSHYFPNINICTSYNQNLCKYYKELIKQLKDKKIDVDNKLLKEFVNLQDDTIDESIAIIFNEISPYFEKYNLSQKVKKSIYKFVDDTYEIMLIKEASKKTKIEQFYIATNMDMLVYFGGDSYQSKISNYIQEQSEKTNFILNYINSYKITQSEALDLLKSFRPSGEVMINLDRMNRKSQGTHAFAYIDICQSGRLRPRKYFTQQQIDLIDNIQNKFGLQILESL